MRKSLLLWILLLLVCVAKANLNDPKSIQFQDKTLVEALELIKEQSGVNFTYSEEIINSEDKISLNVKNEKLFNVLNRVFKGKSIVYKEIGGSIVLSIKLTKYTISGYLVDKSTGEAISGANIFSGRQTDRHGNERLWVL